MDAQTILSLIARHALTTLGGFLAAHGYLGSSTTEGFVSAGMMLAGVAWSWWQKSGQVAVAARLAKLQAHVVAIPQVPSAGSTVGDVALVNKAISNAKIAAS